MINNLPQVIVILIYLVSQITKLTTLVIIEDIFVHGNEFEKHIFFLIYVLILFVVVTIIIFTSLTCICKKKNYLLT